MIIQIALRLGDEGVKLARAYTDQMPVPNPAAGVAVEAAVEMMDK